MRYPVGKVSLHSLAGLLAVLSCGSPEPVSPSRDLLREWQENPSASPLIDFSYAGYRNGTEAKDLRNLDLPGFRVTDFGAIPDDGKDDIDAIQRAVDSAAAVGGGRIYFPRGRYDFDVETTGRFVHVSSSNIFLLGYGEESGGTVIFDHHASPTPVPGKPWLAGTYPSFVSFSPEVGYDLPEVFENPGNLAASVSEAQARGAFTLRVDRPEVLEPGSVYLLTQQETPDSSLVRALTAPLDRVGSRHQEISGPGSYKMRHLVRVVGVEGQRITLDAPLLMRLEPRWQPKLWRVPGLLRDVGIAKFRIENDWSEEFVHHQNGEHDNGFNGVQLRYVDNGWVESIVAYNSSGVVGLSNTINSTVKNCQVRGIPGHNGFTVGGASTRNLLYNLRGGRAMHTFAVSGPASGNVYYNCSADEPSAIDLHAGLGMANLFDNIVGGVFMHGGNAKALPPAMGRGHVFWNWQVGRFEPYKGRPKNTLWKDTELPAVVAVGLRGQYGGNLYYESHGKLLNRDRSDATATVALLNQGPPDPKSLWLWQREQRLGREKRFDF
jgi:hypothetical protein